MTTDGLLLISWLAGGAAWLLVMAALVAVFVIHRRTDLPYEKNPDGGDGDA